jgi:hypothetical protein
MCDNAGLFQNKAICVTDVSSLRNHKRLDVCVIYVVIVTAGGAICGEVLVLTVDTYVT